LLVLLSAFWSNSFFYTFKISLVYVETAVFAIYIGKEYSWTKLYAVMRWVNFVILILSIYYANFVPSVGVHKFGSWQGIIKHKNTFSFLMALTLVLWLIYGIYYPKKRKTAFAIAFLAMIAMNKGGSGAGKVLFVCLIGLMMYLNILKKMRPQWAFVSIIVFFIISICLMILVIENLEFIVVDTLNKDLTLTGRTLFWPIIIDKINQKPIVGYGIGGFWQGWRGLDNPAQDVINPNGFVPPHSHNGFLDIATDLGWLGMTLYILSFINTLGKAVIYLSKEKMPEAGIPLILLTFILMTNITETGLLGVNILWFWYIVIAVKGSFNINSEK
jgi:O-antigen ligase